MPKEDCGMCEGKKMMDCPMEYGGDCPEQCPACGGAQRVVCTECGGTGKSEEDAEDYEENYEPDYDDDE